MKKLLALGLVAAACSAHAVTLFNNGPVVDGSGLSILASGIDSTLGAGSNASATLADNFSIAGASWNVESLDFYGYQTGSVGFTFTGVTWSILSGTDVNTASLVASGTLSPVTNGGLVGYRVTSTTTTNTTRPIFRVSVDIPDIVLSAGSYFVTWALAGSGASGPFVPPVLGSLGTGNALQSLSGGSFVTLADGLSGSTFDVPFTINGSVVAVPEPATGMLLLLGTLGVIGAARRRRAA